MVVVPAGRIVFSQGDEVDAASAQYFVNSSLALALLLRRRIKSVADVLRGTRQHVTSRWNSFLGYAAQATVGARDTLATGVGPKEGLWQELEEVDRTQVVARRSEAAREQAHQKSARGGAWSEPHQSEARMKWRC